MSNLFQNRYYAALEAQLRELGFENDQSSGVICRYLIEGLIIDVMPTESEVLGFANRWYPAGFKSAMDYAVDERTSVLIFTPPYFIAAKLEAFHNRGGNDGRSSSDFEDIIYILNNRPQIWKEFREAPEEVRSYLQTAFAVLVQEPSIEEWISCHLEYPFAAVQSKSILRSLQVFVAK